MVVQQLQGPGSEDSPRWHQLRPELAAEELPAAAAREKAEDERFKRAMAVRIQSLFRKFRAKLSLRRRKLAKQVRNRVDVGVIIFQSIFRGFRARRQVKELRRQNDALSSACSLAIKIQSLYRRYVARRKFYYMIRSASALVLQRCFRGHSAREVRLVEERRVREVCIYNAASTKIQTYWRRKVCREEFLRLKWYSNAAIVIQKVFRGKLGRRLIRRFLQWRQAASEVLQKSPASIEEMGLLKFLLNISISSVPIIKLPASIEEVNLIIGTELIDVFNKKFRRQREEIMAAQTALDKVLRRLSIVDSRLKACERLCGSLLFESASLRRIDRHLSQRESKSEMRLSMLRRGAHLSSGESRSPSHALNLEPITRRRLTFSSNSQELINIHLRFLESSLGKAGVISEAQRGKVVEEMRRLSFIAHTLQSAYIKLECTVKRKFIELQRLFEESKNLLSFQSQLIIAARKVYQIRLEETAVTAMEKAILSASAFELYEKNVQNLFVETESMIDFQFITASVPYSSAASKLRIHKPFPSKAKTCGNVKLLASKPQAEERLNVQIWTVDDVSEWLARIGAEEVITLFRRACVDGACLAALHPEDLINIVGVSRASVANSIISARDSLANGSTSAAKKQASLFPNMPSFESIFTQISSGRVKRVESSLNSGFPINFSDPTGTTLLMTACRCEQRRIVEVLVTRGADVNLQNELGNTALHICFLVKESEHIADFLIAHGADDTIKNFEDLTAYEVLPE